MANLSCVHNLWPKIKLSSVHTTCHSYVQRCYWNAKIATLLQNIGDDFLYYVSSMCIPVWRVTGRLCLISGKTWYATLTVDEAENSIIYFVSCQCQKTICETSNNYRIIYALLLRGKSIKFFNLNIFDWYISC